MDGKMKAAIIESPGELHIKDVPCQICTSVALQIEEYPTFRMTSSGAQDGSGTSLMCNSPGDSIIAAFIFPSIHVILAGGPSHTRVRPGMSRPECPGARGVPNRCIHRSRRPKAL